MTKYPHSQVVTLSGKDWVGLAAMGLTLLIVMMASYLRHDRILTEVLVRQGYLSDQLQSVDDRVDQIEQTLREE